MTAVALPSGDRPVLYDAAHGAAPLVDAIIRYRGLETGALHVPGHAGGRGVGSTLRNLLGSTFLASDVWLTPADATRARREAEALAAKAWGADTALFLLDGSSGGNRAVHLAQQQAGGPGTDHVVIARDSHTSTLAGLVLSGATPHWVTPRIDKAGFGISLGIDPASLDETLSSMGHRAGLVSLVSPGYAGACSDVKALAAVAHRHGTPLFVDEAWGAHLPFHPDLPQHAIAQGADVAVTSAHKMLAAPSGAAIILTAGDRVDAGRISRTVQMTQTTSPLLPVLASIDDARRTMVSRGRVLLDRTLEVVADARRRLAAIPGVRVAEAEDLGVPLERFDPLRLVISVRGLGLTGLELERLLRTPGPGLGTSGLLHPAVAVEGADESNLFVAITTCTPPEVVDALVTALRTVACRPRRRLRPAWDGQLVEALLAPRTQVCTPREAHFAATESVPLERAVGRTSAEPITPYPPGVPSVMPGECLDRDAVTALTRAVASGMHIHGASDPTLTSVCVLRD
ncbi:aminotransferase class I/II-fold pyridoxal phosphate-dependent enzyme [Cryptosporangium phraense]|uniref:Aminotransferase class V-fold PLP-dependent enzyme n=1 Tax=Cryptosporangium phraense TaxID=2593070 RepID=A0A545AGU7_9ACTN|nr:aminotransferase class V-fold PLP-dependent enzyme [Cryptosporangium phraense]TQS40490.1 aminotransferase class V-fold PLP-dependent enzyme [Cryptosporangium phraense]